MSIAALKRAVSAAGGQKPLARAIGTSQPHVWYWLNASAKGVPAEYVIPIERHTGIDRSELRPDLYPEVEAERRRGRKHKP